MIDKIVMGGGQAAGAELLRFLRYQISADDLEPLRSEAGVNFPNTFTFEDLIRPLNEGAFPVADHYEYMWAIHESNLDNLSRLSVFARAYLSVLYVYCNKIQQWGMTVESDYYLMLVEAAVESPAEELPIRLLRFVESLHDHVTGDAGYDDYVCLLSWLALVCITGGNHAGTAYQAIQTLKSRKKFSSYLNEETTSLRSLDDWLVLSARIPGFREVTADLLR